VKKASIEAAAAVIAHLGSFLDSGDIESCVGETFLERLNNDGSRVTALRAIEKVISSDANLNNVREVILAQTSPLVSKNSGIVKVTTLQALNAVVKKYGSKLGA